MYQFTTTSRITAIIIAALVLTVSVLTAQAAGFQGLSSIDAVENAATTGNVESVQASQDCGAFEAEGIACEELVFDEMHLEARQSTEADVVKLIEILEPLIVVAR